MKHALRQLGKNPGFSAIAILTLALGIGVTTAIFSVVYGVLLRPLPYADPDRIVAVNEVTNKGRLNALADPNFDDFRDQSRSFAAIAKYGGMLATVSGGASPPARAIVARVSPQFLRVFGLQPIVGRDFADGDARKGAAPTVMVNYSYWTQFLGSTRDLSTATLKIDTKSYAVVGVLPAAFSFPADAEFWIPTDLEGEGWSRTSHNSRAVARLRDGVSVAQANADVSAIAKRIYADSSEKGSDFLLVDGRVTPLQESITGKAKSPLLILFGAVGFLLLVACANVANLMLAQLSARERELAMRTALGASRGRLVGQFLAEALVLSLAGGGLGVLLAVAGVDALLALAPSNLPRLSDVSVSVPVLAFAFVLATAVAVGLGAFMAMRAASRQPREVLVEGGRSAGSSGTQRVARTIVAAQMAITLVLVVGAGLLGRSLMKVLDVDPGFRIDRIVAMNVSLPWRGFDPKANAGQAAFYASLIERLRRIPGVRGVGATSGLPLEGGNPDGTFAIVGPNELPTTMRGLSELFKQKDRIGTADFCVATDDYFRVLGIPLVRGRLFDARDGADAPHAAVITQSLAKIRWPNEDPIGRTIEFGNMDGDLRLMTIVGIVGDTHQYGLDAPPEPTVYANLFQRPRAAMTFTMLSDADTQSVAGAARSILRELDPETPAKFQTFQQVYAASLGSRRFNVILIGFFGVTALVLAMIGVFGVMAHAVSRRTREIGVRVALGASRGAVQRMVLAQGLRPIAAGVVVGIAGALALTRFVGSLLFGVSATDPLTFAAVTVLLVGTALVACYIPARRATRVDPMIALRAE